MYLYELFDKTARVSERTDANGNTAYFFSVDGVKYEAVCFSHDKVKYEFMFDMKANPNGMMEPTNLHHQFKVLSTIGKIVKSFLTKYKPEELEFSGYQKRGDVYEKMLRMFKGLPYDVKVTPAGDTKYFNLIRKD